MHLLNFKKEFKYRLTDGIKNTTIRQPRKRPIRQYDQVRIYTGLRTKNTELLGDSEVIKKVEIKIMANRTIIPLSESSKVTKIGDPLSPEEVEMLAHRDGFDSVYEFFLFFEKNYELPDIFELYFFKPLGRGISSDKEVIIWKRET